MRTIIKLDNYYLEWSGIVDAPVTLGMTRDQAYEYLVRNYGSDTVAEERLRRVDAHGTSSLQGHTVEDTIQGNRAGPDETCLTREEILQQYCVEKNRYERN